MGGNQWGAQWVQAAERAIKEGDEHLGDDRLVAARDCYLRAAEYYRLALGGTEQATAEHRSWSDGQVSAFRAAMPLLPHPATPFALGVGSVQVAGYLFRAWAHHPPMTVVCRPEQDAASESLYLSTAAPILDLGLNCAIFGFTDHGTTGHATPFSTTTLTFDELTGTALKSVAEFLRRQPGIDAERILLAPTGSSRH